MMAEKKKEETVRRKNTKVGRAHDPENECSVGDMVRFEESKPISKRKRWVVTGILEKAKV